MNNNGFHKTDLPCDFSEMLVSYIYGEATKSEAQFFETHLKNCLPCADEVGSFGLIRNSIVDWRNEEFAPLATPVVEISYSSTQEISTFTAPVYQTNSKTSWFETIREKFSFGLMPLVAGFAAILICLGIGFLLLNSTEKNNSVVAEKNKIEQPSPILSPSETPKKPLVANSNSSSQPETAKPQQTEIAVAPPKPEISNQSRPNQTTLPKVVKQTISTTKQPSNARPQSDKNPNNNQQKPASKANPKPSKDVEIYSEDDEDDSPRLADLFDEITASK